MRIIDLRSDTVTKPTEEMRYAMARAQVGDDVYGEDPTVNRLQEMAAEILGKEAGLFVASGTMGNVVAILSYGSPGDEIIVGSHSHIFLYEGGGASALAGVQSYNVLNEPDGTISIEAIEVCIRADDDHCPRTRLICLENTHNRCGGIALPPTYCDAVGDLAHSRDVAVHLDGARLFNAAVALGIEPRKLTQNVDSVMICLSKGLGAPVGSVLCGTRKFISRAKRMRKVVGGGMRQAGIIAAAGIYALEHHLDRLVEDHRNAGLLAEGIDAMPGFTCGAQGCNGCSVQTNIVYFKIDSAAIGDPSLNAIELLARLRSYGILAGSPLGGDGYTIRMVTHLDVTQEDIEHTLSTLQNVVKNP